MSDKADKDKNATTGISQSLFRTGVRKEENKKKNPDRQLKYPLWIYLAAHLDFFPSYPSSFLSSLSVSANSFSFLTRGDSLQAAGEPLHPNQTAERTSAH